MSKLLTNTTDLQEVLQALQNKAAGSGGGSPIEVWTGTIPAPSPLPPIMGSVYCTIHYTDESLNMQMLEVTSLPATIRVAKNTIFYVSSEVTMNQSSSVESLFSYSHNYVFLPTSNDFEIIITL